MLITNRTPNHPIEPILLNRYSSYDFADKQITEPELLTILEAARWAPSSYNNQLWHFAYATKNDPHWSEFLALLLEANQKWAKDTSALIATFSRTHNTHNGNAHQTHALEAGMALQNLMIQAASLGYSAHSMGGFDQGKASNYFNIPDKWQLHCFTAIGAPVDPSKEDISTRKPLAEISTSGKPKLQ